MKKSLLFFLIIVLLPFLFITWLKFRSTTNDQGENRSTQNILEKERITRFWQYYRQATQQRIENDIESARANYEKALELNPDHENSLYYLGNIYFEMGEFAKAEALWKHLLEVNPTSSRAYFQLGNLYLQHDPPHYFDLHKAEAAFRKALEINKEETAPVLRLGQIALIRGDYTGAKQLFDDVIATNFRSTEAYFLNAYIAWKQGREEQVQKYLQTAFQVTQSKKPAHGVKGEGATKSGRPILFEGRYQHSIFKPYYSDLFTGTQDHTTKIFLTRFQQLDRLLTKLRSLAE